MSFDRHFIERCERTNERTKAQEDEDEENQIAIAHPKNGSSVSSISSLITTKTMEERIKLKMLLSVKTL
jgi:hypothetical protein